MMREVFQTTIWFRSLLHRLNYLTRFMRRARSWKTLVSHMRLPLLPLTDHLTRQSNMQDYEGELALVIDKKCRDVEIGKALEYVGGYFVLDDISARDVQFIDKLYSRAKSFDSFGPCGPWIVTRDEIPDPNDLQLITKVNEEVRQSSSTSNLVLNIEKIVNSLSGVMTLEAGDIISTGTPSGTGLSMSSHIKYLQHGDIVEVEVEGIGKIRNKVKFVR